MPIFNPLNEVPVQQESTSSMINDVIGVCPKCKNAFSSGVIANGDQVFYCATCRVSQPMPT